VGLIDFKQHAISFGGAGYNVPDGDFSLSQVLFSESSFEIPSTVIRKKTSHGPGRKGRGLRRKNKMPRLFSITESLTFNARFARFIKVEMHGDFDKLFTFGVG
jgi:hypothetical protein